MIIFIANGRLGNQIFQYQFLKTVQKNNEALVVSGFTDLQNVFEINDIINLDKKNRWLRAFSLRVLQRIFIFLSNKKLISSIEVKHKQIFGKYFTESTALKTTFGAIKSLKFVKTAYFQDESFFDKNIASKLKIKNIYLDKAAKILNSIPEHHHKVFVHIRRADYKDFTIYGKSTLLPLSYYKKQISWFLNNRKDCFFIFLSDDTDFVKKEFGSMKNKMIATGNYHGTDLAIMTQCKSAILSPSSFGWWGSYLMKDKDIIFAPKYWLGFNSKENYGTSHLFAKTIEII